jgi:hypothetical protein
MLKKIKATSLVANARGIKFYKSNITGNNAIKGGGGIYYENGIVTINDCSITGTSAEWGAGIINDDDSVMTQDDVPIKGNIARGMGDIGGEGGGIWNNAFVYFKGGCIVENQPNNVHYHNLG